LQKKLIPAGCYIDPVQSGGSVARLKITVDDAILAAIERHGSGSFTLWEALILEAALRGGAERWIGH
jgi:hypothetical protein